MHKNQLERFYSYLMFTMEIKVKIVVENNSVTGNGNENSYRLILIFYLNYNWRKSYVMWPSFCRRS